MQFASFAPKHKALQPHIPYILFNQSSSIATQNTFTSFPNNNITLCIVKGKRLDRLDHHNSYSHSHTLSSFLSGLYLQPNSFKVEGIFDEICIEFSVQGYNKFFPFPAKSFIANEDVLTEAFGKDSVHFFEKVFEQKNLKLRCQMIEGFLLGKIRTTDVSFSDQVLKGIEQLGLKEVGEISKYFKCSEKKLYRTFKSRFDISPKEYLQLLRFRQGLSALQNSQGNLTDISYDLGYCDQSHFIREFKKFAQVSPRSLRKEIQEVNGQVLITVA